MSYIPYVNIKQGSHSCERLSTGSTLPLTQLPFGMASFIPQTDGRKDPWFFHPDDYSLEGIRLTHQPSPWINDYGALLFLPQTGTPESVMGRAFSSYRPKEAVLRPDRLQLCFARYRTTAELVPTERGAYFSVEYGDGRAPFLSFFPAHGDYHYELDAENDRLIGYTTGHSHDVAVDFHMFFVVQFAKGSVDAAHTQVFANGQSCGNGTQVHGAGVGIHIALNTPSVQAQLAISYISVEQALENLRQDAHPDGMAGAARAAEATWEEYLSRIEVTSDDEEQLRTFYSCMYRSFLFPHKAFEYTAEGEAVHYVPATGKVGKGKRYTDLGFWDVYRTLFPLYSLIAKEEYAEMLEAFLIEYRECGWLPRWLSIGEVGCMPSTLIDATIADAVVKGIGTPELWEGLLEGMLHHANETAPRDCYGRTGVAAYLEYGYVPNGVVNPCVNLTLDAAYGDFCIAQVAKALGKTDIEAEYRQRALNYRHLFDKETGFMRAKDTEGNFVEPFDPFVWGGPYCESSAWQATFAVPHDVEGLAALYGGPEAMCQKLDELFATPPHYDPAGYGFVIHEMIEMARADFGQMAISNQPSFHLPYLYAMLGQPEKTAYWVEKLCREAFSAADDGFPGDEDNGTTAAWYIFSTLGLYPVCPGKAEYVRTPMLVRSARIAGVDWDNTDLPVMIPHDAVLKEEK